MLARPIAATAALAAAGMLLAPASASAQAYPYQGPQNYGTGAYAQPYDYDNRYGYQDSRYGDYRHDEACRSYRNDRQAGGAVIGATVGAVAGSQLAARGRRTEGSLLGGVLGAVVGAGVGGSSARDCERYDSNYRYDDSRYGDRYGYQSPDRYDDRYGYDDRYYGDDRYRYGQSAYGYSERYSSGYQSGYATDRYGCRTIETRSYTRDGRLVTRYEQSCPNRY
jgi:hypothetical protein